MAREDDVKVRAYNLRVGKGKGMQSKAGYCNFVIFFQLFN